jgi:hypothetical protein
MSTNFFTNKHSNTLLEKFRGIFENHTDIECFDALVGYFKASGYFALRPFLNDVPQIRILVGIEIDIAMNELIQQTGNILAQAQQMKPDRFPIPVRFTTLIRQSVSAKSQATLYKSDDNLELHGLKKQ